MKPSSRSVQYAGILLIVAIAIASIVRSVSQSSLPESSTRSAVTSPVLHLEQLDQEAAVPGRVITAKIHGRTVATYTCQEDDVAVAVIRTGHAGQSGLSTPTLVNQNGLESHGNAIAVNVEPTANAAITGIFFVTLKAGFSHPLGQVSVTPRNSSGDSFDQAIIFTKISPPKRRISPPTGPASELAEETARAEIVTGSGGQLNFTIKETPPKGEEILAKCEESSFSKSCNFTPSTAEDADAVRIRLERHRRVESIETLTYHDAEMAMVNGNRMLILPIAEPAGTLNGRKADILKFTRESAAHSKRSGSRGVISVHLAPAEVVRMDLGPGYSKILAVEPSLSKLGLESLSVSVEGSPDAPSLKAIRGEVGGSMTAVKTLKLTFKTVSTKEVSARTLILPVHHVKRLSKGNVVRSKEQASRAKMTPMGMQQR